MEYFDLLPEDITADILSRLPIESVLECKLVCTAWRGLVRRSTFSKMHLHRHSDSGKSGFIAFTCIQSGFASAKSSNFQYFEYNDENHEKIRTRRLNFNLPLGWNTRFLGSCNGLICYLRENTYTVCNPLTREYIMIPEIKRVGMGHEVSGFGYLDSTNEYKVVRIMFENENENDTEFMEVHIYTLGNGLGWRNIGNFKFGSREHSGEGLFFNGTLYWLDFVLRMFVTFDLYEEKFCELVSPPPPVTNSNFNDYYKLGVLDGCFYFAVNLLNSSGLCWDVWLLKNKNDNYDMQEREGHQATSWSRVFSVRDRPSSYLFAVTKSYSVLTYRGNQIEIHDLEASTSERIVVFEENIGAVFSHKNTFVSLKEIGEADTEMMD